MDLDILTRFYRLFFRKGIEKTKKIMSQTIETLRQRVAAAITEKETKKASLTQSLTAATVRVKDLEAQLKNTDDYETVSAIRAELVSRNDYISLIETKLRMLDTCTEEEKAVYAEISADANTLLNEANDTVWQYLAGINQGIVSKYTELEEVCQTLREIVSSYRDAFNIEGAESRYKTASQLEAYKIAAFNFSGNKAE